MTESTHSCDFGPEEMEFIPAASSPGGVALLLVANEVSVTPTIYTIEGN
ncbi:hypothetical protein [Coraliomargarita parva]|nr:hypothetical protein [Coraliomargarita parva]